MRQKKAFTIFELLVSLAIIGLIVSLTAVKLNQIRAQARDTTKLNDVSAILSALASYKQKFGFYPPTLTFGSALKSPDSTYTFLVKVPNNGQNLSGTTCVNHPYSYTTTDNGFGFILNYCLETQNGANTPGVKSATMDKLVNDCNLTSPTAVLTPGDGQMTVSWSAVSGASQYKVYGNTSGLPILKTTTTSLSYVETGLTNGNTYYYGVSATVCGTDNATSTQQSAFVGCNLSNWTSRVNATDISWFSVTYGAGLFVAVAYTGSGNRIMTSPDGITWTSRTGPSNLWESVTYGNGTFVAVAANGSGNSVMTSPDGITWTSRSGASNNYWHGVTYGNGLFVAVSTSGTGNRVMTSPDGITWTSRVSASDSDWQSVTYANGLFVAVADTGINQHAMTSPDGITWTLMTTPNKGWHSVTYGAGLFVSVSNSSGIMTSPDGITWTSRSQPAVNSWESVIYGRGLFVAVSDSGTGNRIMTSYNGINWTIGANPVDNFWYSVTYGNGTFVAVSYGSGAGNRVMTASCQ